MAKKGRRRKRKKQNNVIQFPGQGTAAVDEAENATGAKKEVTAARAKVEEAMEAIKEKKEALEASTEETVVDVAAPSVEDDANATADEDADEDADKADAKADSDKADADNADADAKKDDDKSAKKADVKKADAKKDDAKADAKGGGKSSKKKKKKPESDADANPSKKSKSKKKKAKTTSSQMIRAITASGEHAAVEAEFFQADAYEKSRQDVEPETWADVADDGTRAYEARWRKITLTIAALGVSGIIGALVYVNYFAVRPAETNRRRGSEPPTKVVITPSTTEASATTTEATSTTSAAASATVVTEAATEEPLAPAEVATAEVATGEATGEEATGEDVTAEAASEAAAAEAAAAEAAASEAAASEAAAAEAAAAEAAAAETAAAEAAVAEAEPEDGAETYASVLEEAQGARGRRQLELYRRAIELNPNGAEALTAVAFRQLNRGRYEEARDLSRRATASDPTISKAWVTLGAASEALRDRTAAHQAYSSCEEQATGRLVAECRRGARRTRPR